MYDRSKHVEVCRKKMWYETIAEAESNARRMEGLRGYPMYYYHCPICKLYHITSKYHSSAQRQKLWDMEIAYQALNSRPVNKRYLKK